MPIPKNFSPSIRMSAKEKAFIQIQQWIIEGTLEPGEKIYDNQLSEALGVSRTPVREALQLLEIQGFVEMHPGKETRVTPITREDVQKIYPPLASLQALAAEETAKSISSDQISQLYEIHQKYEKAIHQEQPLEAMEMDEQFHNLIVDIADNPYIADFSSILQLHIRRLKYIFLSQQMTVKEESLREHEQMIQAFENHDPQKAATIMKQNWMRPMREVYRVLDETIG